MKWTRTQLGFTLIELVIGLGIASFLITAIAQLVIAASASYQLQQNLGALQENARFALSTIQREIEAAGSQQQPWKARADWAIDSTEGVSAVSDKLRFRRWSDRNCYDNFNMALDEKGNSEFYLRETSFVVTRSDNLAQTCRYGPDSGQLTTQINNLGLVQNAEALQALYAEDTDSDGNADRWVAAGQWLDEANILAVRLAVLLASPDPVSHPQGGSIKVLDTIIKPSNDGRIRRGFESTFTIRGRSN